MRDCAPLHRPHLGDSVTATERATEAAAEAARIEAEIATAKQHLEGLYGALWNAHADQREAEDDERQEKETDE